ncbi:hypothetical protein T492DRAFT_375617 [Pavlovales sp. CCMP2436]|nr:hypothetical protein T492DRAFT_375617 [Pavlovales sp. CCMP2436]
MLENVPHGERPQTTTLNDSDSSHGGMMALQGDRPQTGRLSGSVASAIAFVGVFATGCLCGSLLLPASRAHAPDFARQERPSLNTPLRLSAEADLGGSSSGDLTYGLSASYLFRGIDSSNNAESAAVALTGVVSEIGAPAAELSFRAFSDMVDFGTQLGVKLGRSTYTALLDASSQDLRAKAAFVNELSLGPDTLVVLGALVILLSCMRVNI